MKHEQNDKPGVIMPPPLIYVTALLISMFAQSCRPLPLPFIPRKVRTLMGLSLIGTASIALLLSLQAMRRAGTNVSPERPTTALVQEFPYTLTRNPIYLSLTLLYSGLATLLNTGWAILLLPIVLFLLKWGVIEREEHYLEHKFGEQYRMYMRHVHRWI